MNEARGEYTRRLKEIDAALAKMQRLHISIGNCRLVLFIAIAVLAYFAFVSKAVSALWIALPVIAFIVLAFYHEGVLRSQRKETRRQNYYLRGMARIENRWKAGDTGIRYSNPGHEYAQDLDLFGEGGLFELLSCARTEPGSDKLAAWLLAPANLDTIRERHQAIEELRHKLDFRERLAVTGDETVTRRAAAPLWSWGDAHALGATTALRLTALLLSVAMAFAMLWFAWDDFNWLGGAAAKPPLNAVRLLIAMGLLNGGFALLWRRRVARSIQEFEPVRHGIELTARLLNEVERESFTSAPLARLKASLGTAPPPSGRVRRLNLIADFLDSRDNLFVRVFGPPLLWTTQTVFALEHWRDVSGSLTRTWVDAVAELEALASLATYAFEHPDDICPEFRNDPGLHAHQLRHPLIPDCVPNDVRFDADQPLLIISGSNMSGKSTYLRTIGVNMVLALAGAPVRASSFSLSPLCVAASLRVSDSLAEGESHFSAEIKRIRLILDRAEDDGTVLFLVDEILQGTNSHDRLTGTAAILERLRAAGALGAITTHDLALTRLGGTNVHFKDFIQDGNMKFDYRLKPGVVEGSNALELMHLYGLM